MPSSKVPDWFNLGCPSDSVASIWKCASTKGGDTKHPPASMISPAFASILGSTETILSRAMATSTRRPSSRAPFFTMMSKTISALHATHGLSFTFMVCDHQCAGIGGTTRHGDQRQNWKNERQHEKDLVGHESSSQLLQPQLIGIESGKQ